MKYVCCSIVRGLGKSLQALTALAVLRLEKEMNTKPFLVVCPASVVQHWVDETARYFPEKLLLALPYSDLKGNMAEALCGRHIIVVSYEMLRRDVSSGAKSSKLLNQIWEAAVLDEAHLIKNPEAATTRAVCALKCKHRIALSGTPVQNQVHTCFFICFNTS